MLRSLELRDVGPAREMKLELAPRLNVLTGDNGLGKTFVLDLLWFVLTRTWAGEAALPHHDAEVDDTPGTKGSRHLSSALRARVSHGATGSKSYQYVYALDWQAWVPAGGVISSSDPDRAPSDWPTPVDSVVIFARVDGSFAVWDTLRNRDWGDRERRQPAYVFDREEVWNGLRVDDGGWLCEGLIRDWVFWQQTSSASWTHLVEVLGALSGSGMEQLKPGPPRRVKVSDVRDIPTLEMPYGVVPVTHASAGMRRICALAYVIVWAWQEHKIAASLHHSPPTRQLVVLVDEVEAHLDPKWQRSILPALLGVLSSMGEDVRSQVVVATHSPLVLASLEPEFDEEQDSLFHLDLDGSVIRAVELPFSKQGDASHWLVSESFGLASARSSESQHAIEAALAFMRGDLEAASRAFLLTSSPPPPIANLKDQIHEALCRLLPGHDPFWPRWIVTYERAATPDARAG